MGFVHAEITLKNAIDVGDCDRGFINEQKIRQATVTAKVDTGAATMVINKKLRLQLGLEIRRECEVRLANNAKETVQIADPVQIHWKNRSMVCEPWVIPGDGKILLGAIPLENMDLIVDPKRQELTGAHGEEPLGII